MLDTFRKLPLDKQERILDAAATVFAEQGYHHSSIAKICETAEISNGALYKYFENKEALFFSVLDRCVDLLVTKLLKTNADDMTSLYDSIHNILCRIKQFSIDSKIYLSIYSDLGSSSINYFSQKASSLIEGDAHEQWIRIIEKGKQLGEIDDNINSNIAAFVIDNNVMLFIYSLVSEYHHKRFVSFFPSDVEDLDINEKIRIIMESIKVLLKKPHTH